MEYLKQFINHTDRRTLGQLLLGALLILAIHLLWQAMPIVLSALNPTVGLLDGGIWQLLLFSIICFLVLLSLCVLLLKWFLDTVALPPILNLTSQFKTLTLWQQLSLYWASFALLFLGALLSLSAIF